MKFLRNILITVLIPYALFVYLLNKPDPTWKEFVEFMEELYG